MEDSTLDPSELRNEGVKELYLTLSVKHTTITIKECGDIYDQMMMFYEEHKVLRRIKDEGQPLNVVYLRSVLEKKSLQQDSFL